MFDSFRDAVRALRERGASPDARREILREMKGTLVQAKVGLEGLRDGVKVTRARLEKERGELETVMRRRALAEGIGDEETVRVADQFASRHQERVSVLEQKLAAQEAELALVEGEVESMTRDLKALANGAVPPPSARSPEERALEELERDDGAVADEIASLGRARARASVEEDAARRLEELKRRMGK